MSWAKVRKETKSSSINIFFPKGSTSSRVLHSVANAYIEVSSRAYMTKKFKINVVIG